MPTYDYECTVCKHTFEAFHSITADALETCPVCGKKLKRLIGGGMGIIFKGSGFYTTDYKKTSVVTGGNGSSPKRASKEPAKPEEKKPVPVSDKSDKKEKTKA